MNGEDGPMDVTWNAPDDNDPNGSLGTITGNNADGWDLTVPTGTGTCLLYTSPSPRDATLSRMPSSA